MKKSNAALMALGLVAAMMPNESSWNDLEPLSYETKPKRVYKKDPKVKSVRKKNKAARKSRQKNRR